MKTFPPLNFDNLKEYFLDRSTETTMTAETFTT